MIVTKREWSNCSVRAIAEGGDPVEALVSKIRQAVFQAIEEGFSGPPFDPFELAGYLGFVLFPSAEIRDARVVPVENDGFKIEFNPNMAKSRIRFSIAHEIAHAFFPDCDKSVRHRLTKQDMTGEDWELEMLCNIGAAEMLMPIGSFPSLKDEELTIKNLLRLRKQFEVSIEAVLLRVIKLTETPCFVFSASKDEYEKENGYYYIDYSSASVSFPESIPYRLRLPKNSVVADCVAIGFEATGVEAWSADFNEFEVQCVGIPPYPGKNYPRVVGLARHLANGSRGPCKSIQYVVGDVTIPRGSGRKIIAHIVNDRAKRWGGRGFAYTLSKKWPKVYQDFSQWCLEDVNNFTLGESKIYHYDDDLIIFTMLAQHGYGKSLTPRIRYSALEKCLTLLYQTAINFSASVHMPRIGCGHGGGEWSIISEMLDNILVQRDVKVTVYDLPK